MYGLLGLAQDTAARRSTAKSRSALFKQRREQALRIALDKTGVRPDLYDSGWVVSTALRRSTSTSHFPCACDCLPFGSCPFPGPSPTPQGCQSTLATRAPRSCVVVDGSLRRKLPCKHPPSRLVCTKSPSGALAAHHSTQPGGNFALKPPHAACAAQVICSKPEPNRRRVVARQDA